MTTFYRLLKDTDKAAALRTAVNARRSGDTDAERTFTVDPAAFSKVPNTPFAYWVDDEIRDLFVKLPPFESEGRTVKQGLATADDFRFVRAWWEVDPARRLDPGLGGAPDWREDLEGFQAWCRRRTHQGKGWAPFAKGGEYSPYYSDIHLVVNWEREGEEIKNFVDPKTGKQNSRPQNTDYYFRPGVTWPVRASKFTPWSLFAGSIPSVTGYAVYFHPEDMDHVVSVFNSDTFDYLFKTSLERFLHPKFLVGVLKLMPWPNIGESAPPSAASQIVLGRAPWTLDDRTNVFRGLIPEGEPDQAAASFLESDDHGFSSYGLSGNQRGRISRFHEERAGIKESDEDDDTGETSTTPFHEIETYFGSAMGRWDVRLLKDSTRIPALPDPFDPLPVVPPAMLVGPDGLRATSGKIVSQEWLQARPNAITLPPAGTVVKPTIADDEYPIPIPWDGILVDDPDHPSDIVGRIRQVLSVLHGEGAEQAEEKLCGELGVDTLREYIRRYSGFFALHYGRYSGKGLKRKAPIYWPLSTPSGGWTAWIYYPRLTDATIYTLIERYLHPQLELARQLYEEVARIPAASRSPGQQRQFDLSSRDKDELATMEEELKRIAAMPYRVNHDDGVPILAAPFAAMFRHREWTKYLTGIWEKLEAGEYDWAHLAYAVWPERVREKARDDRSIAIAHGIEEAQ